MPFKVHVLWEDGGSAEFLLAMATSSAPALAFDVPLWMNHLPGIPLPASFTAAFPRQRIALSLQDILGGRAWHSVVFSNYMTDLDWLAHQLPGIFGESSDTEVCVLTGEEELGHVTAAATLHKFKHRVAFARRPPLPISFGTHHTKAIFAFSDDLSAIARGDGTPVTPVGVRVAILTCNFICDDVQRKNQGFFVQDFPLLNPQARPASASSPNDFGPALMRYLAVACGGRLVKPLDSLAVVDFSRAAAHLVASVPGYHQVSDAAHWGQARLAAVLKKDRSHRVDSDCLGEHTRPRLVWQYSSQGSLTDKFLDDMAAVMSPPVTSSDFFRLSPQKVARSESGGGTAANAGAAALSKAEVQVVIPTQEEVRGSIEGWRAGMSIPIHMKTYHPFINARLYRFTPSHFFRPEPTRTAPPLSIMIASMQRPEAEQTSAGRPIPPFRVCSGRHRAMPHIKSYMLLYEQRPSAAVAGTASSRPPFAAWVCVTSSNLSRAAWGDWQKQGQQLMIRSYELGVVFTPGLPPITPSSFSLTPHDPIVPLGVVDVQQHAQVLAELQMCYGAHPVFLGLTANGAQRALFMPYCVHALQPYSTTAHGFHSASGTAQDVPWAVDYPFQQGALDSLGYDCSIMATYSHYGEGSWTAKELSWTVPNCRVEVAQANASGDLSTRTVRDDQQARAAASDRAAVVVEGTKDDPMVLDTESERED
jgi:tyrosyl-DNA phosphodiesterase-1